MGFMKQDYLLPVTGRVLPPYSHDSHRANGFNPRGLRIGYQLARNHWGKGLATSVSKLLLQFGFDGFCTHKITVDCYAGNKDSERVMQKVGMTKEGRQRDFYPYRGGFDDRIHYGIRSRA